MPRPSFIPAELPTEAERRERQHEMGWLTDLDQPRRPERNRGRSDYGDAPQTKKEPDPPQGRIGSRR